MGKELYGRIAASRSAFFAALVCVTLWAAVGQARILTFAGRTWHVKTGAGGPGPNIWSDATNSVWVDAQGWMHLRIRNENGVWHCAEVWTTEPTRHGPHRFKIVGRPDAMDRNVVFSPFLYHDDAQEVDIEFSSWGAAQTNAPNTQYVVQPPPYTAANRHAFTTELSGNYSTHVIDWQAEGVRFKSFHGHYTEPPNPGYLIQQYDYAGPGSPPESLGLHIHLNLWLVDGVAPANEREAEIVVREVAYPPLVNSP